MKGAFALLLVACTGPTPDPKDRDEETDTETTPETITATGLWSGTCEGIWSQTASTPTTYAASFLIELDLTESDGAVTGTMVFADYTGTIVPAELSGSRQGTTLTLESPETEDHLGYRFDLALEGDTATGLWSFFSSTSAVQDPLDCALTR